MWWQCALRPNLLSLSLDDTIGSFSPDHSVITAGDELPPRANHGAAALSSGEDPSLPRYPPYQIRHDPHVPLHVPGRLRAPMFPSFPRSLHLHHPKSSRRLRVECLRHPFTHARSMKHQRAKSKLDDWATVPAERVRKVALEPRP